MSDKIPGGYYIKARKIQSAEIALAPPHVREIWDWLIMQCNHADTPTCKRGQCVRTYSDIQEGLKWYVGYRKCMYKKHHCEISMKWLTKHGMITTMKTTRGIIVTICKYNYYQDPKNYESYTKADTKATVKLQCTDTINKKEKKDKKEKNKTPLDIAIERFAEHRRAIKKPCTDHALDLIKEKAFKLGGDEAGAIEIIDYAIMRGWQGIFPITDNSKFQGSAPLQLDEKGNVI